MMDSGLFTLRRLLVHNHSALCAVRCNVDGPTAHWSDYPLVRKPIGPMTHWSENVNWSENGGAKRGGAGRGKV